MSDKHENLIEILNSFEEETGTSVVILEGITFFKVDDYIFFSFVGGNHHFNIRMQRDDYENSELSSGSYFTDEYDIFNIHRLYKSIDFSTLHNDDNKEYFLFTPREDCKSFYVVHPLYIDKACKELNEILRYLDSDKIFEDINKLM